MRRFLNWGTFVVVALIALIIYILFTQPPKKDTSGEESDAAAESASSFEWGWPGDMVTWAFISPENFIISVSILGVLGFGIYQHFKQGGDGAKHAVSILAAIAVLVGLSFLVLGPDRSEHLRDVAYAAIDRNAPAVETPLDRFATSPKIGSVVVEIADGQKTRWLTHFQRRCFSATVTSGDPGLAIEGSVDGINPLPYRDGQNYARFSQANGKGDITVRIARKLYGQCR